MRVIGDEGPTHHVCSCDTIRPWSPTRYRISLWYGLTRGVQGSFRVPWDSMVALIVRESESTVSGARSFTVDRVGSNKIVSAFWAMGWRGGMRRDHREQG